jgi:hypothetical protein
VSRGYVLVVLVQIQGAEVGVGEDLFDWNDPRIAPAAELW